MFGAFIYAETTSSANNTAKSPARADTNVVKDLKIDELFSIVARTTKTPARLPVTGFFNEGMTYFSSFSMYLGLVNDVVIDVGIDPNSSYQFSKQDTEINCL